MEKTPFSWLVRTYMWDNSVFDYEIETNLDTVYVCVLNMDVIDMRFF